MATVAIYDRYHTECLQNMLISLGRPIILIIDSNIANTSEKNFRVFNTFRRLTKFRFVEDALQQIAPRKVPAGVSLKN